MDDSDKQGLFYLIQFCVICSLFLAAITVLDGFFGLFSYLAYLRGDISPVHQAELHEAMAEMSKTPVKSMGLTLYNLIVWNTVIVLSIWVLRRRAWAYHSLRHLLGFDMIVTVLLLLYPLLSSAISGQPLGVRPIPNPSVYILMNMLQVGVIVAMAHPRVQEAIVDEGPDEGRRNEQGV